MVDYILVRGDLGSIEHRRLIHVVPDEQVPL